MWLEATWILGFRGFLRWLDRASFSDGQLIEATAAPVGHVHVPRLSPPTHGARCLRLSEGAHHHARPARKKTVCGCCGRIHSGWYDRRIRQVRDLPCGDTRIFLEIEVRRVRCRSCGKVKRERLDFLADNPLYTKRFAHYVGQRCRQATIKDIAEELKLDWDTVKTLEKQYMEAQLARAGELGFHVLLLQRLDRIPVELQLLGNVLDRRLPTALAHVMGKALRIERVVRQEIEPLALHLAATAASHPPDLNLQEDARVAARQITNLPYTPVVPTRMNSPAAPANRFFARRASVMMRAFGSPKTPRTVGWGRKPGNMYVSHRRRCRFDELAIGK